MTGYHCILCNFHTKIKSHYERHTNTKKHQNNVEKEKEKKKEKLKEECICKFCNKYLSSKQSLKRHIEKSCIKNKNSEKSKKHKAEIEKIKESKIYKYIHDIDTNKVTNQDIGDKYKSNNNLNDIDEGDNPPQNKNDPFHNFMNNFKDPNNINTNTKVTHNTRVTINGIDIGDNPLQKPGIKKALIAAFKHPFFKNNLNYVPINFFEDDDFRENFNDFHELSIENPKVKQLDFIENMNEYISKNINQNLNNTVIESFESDDNEQI